MENNRRMARKFYLAPDEMETLKASFTLFFHATPEQRVNHLITATARVGAMPRYKNEALSQVQCQRIAVKSLFPDAIQVNDPLAAPEERKVFVTAALSDYEFQTFIKTVEQFARMTIRQREEHMLESVAVAETLPECRDKRKKVEVSTMVRFIIKLMAPDAVADDEVLLGRRPTKECAQLGGRSHSKKFLAQINKEYWAKAAKTRIK